MTEFYWEMSFFSAFLIWCLVRTVHGCRAMQGKSKERVRPGLERFLVFLNFIGQYKNETGRVFPRLT